MVCNWPNCERLATKFVGDREYCNECAEKVQELRWRAIDGQFAIPIGEHPCKPQPRS